MGQHLNFRFALLLLIFLFLLISTSMAVTKNATVVLKSGEIYTDVAVAAKSKFKIIEIKSNDGSFKKNISFTQIKSISDKNDKDITHSLLGRWFASADKKTGVNHHKEEPETWLSENDPKVIEAKKKKWNVAFRAGSSYSVPFGRWFENVHSGIGFNGEFIIATSRHFALRFEYSQVGLSIDDDYLNLRFSNPDHSSSEQQCSQTARRYYLSWMYFNRVTDKNQRLKYTYYVWAGIGLIIQEFDLNATVVNVNTGATLQPFSSIKKYGKLSRPFGGGVIIPVSKYIGIDFGASFDLIFEPRGEKDSIIPYYNYRYALIANLNIGLIYFL